MRYATILQSFVGRTCRSWGLYDVKSTRSALRILCDSMNLGKIEGWLWDHRGTNTREEQTLRLERSTTTKDSIFFPDKLYSSWQRAYNSLCTMDNVVVVRSSPQCIKIIRPSTTGCWVSGPDFDSHAWVEYAGTTKGIIFDNGSLKVCKQWTIWWWWGHHPIVSKVIAHPRWEVE
jgi:hypothetical protein